jgi:hypothetical protein
MRLHEDYGPVWIDTRGEQAYGHFECAGRELSGAVVLSYRMIVDDAKEALVLVLKANPVAHGTQVVAEMQLA